MKYTEHEASCKVHYFECTHAVGEYKGYKIIIRRGAGCITTVVEAPIEIKNDIINEIVTSQVRIFDLVGESKET